MPQERPISDRTPPQGFELRGAKPLHAGRIFDLVSERVRLPSGLEQELDIVVHGGAVAIAALREDGKLICVRQYRHAVGEMLVEIPAGRLEAGEEPLAAARRELEEETGFRAASWRERLRLIPAPGFCSERIVLFEARDLEAVPGGGLQLDDDEEIELCAFSPAEILSGDVTADAKTLVVASWFIGEASPAER